MHSSKILSTTVYTRYAFQQNVFLISGILHHIFFSYIYLATAYSFISLHTFISVFGCKESLTYIQNNNSNNNMNNNNNNIIIIIIIIIIIRIRIRIKIITIFWKSIVLWKENWKQRELQDFCFFNPRSVNKKME